MQEQKYIVTTWNNQTKHFNLRGAIVRAIEVSKLYNCTATVSYVLGDGLYDCVIVNNGLLHYYANGYYKEHFYQARVFMR